jgi:hypothetical protein
MVAQHALQDTQAAQDAGVSGVRRVAEYALAQIKAVLDAAAQLHHADVDEHQLLYEHMIMEAAFPEVYGGQPEAEEGAWGGSSVPLIRPAAQARHPVPQAAQSAAPTMMSQAAARVKQESEGESRPVKRACMVKVECG